MNDIDLLAGQVEQYPTNPIVASMLVDELIDNRDMNRSEAEGHVKRVQEVAIDAAFLRRATEIVSGCPWQQCWARDRIQEGLVFTTAARPTILLVAGLQGPVRTQTFNTPGMPAHLRDLITVGGQWVVREYREYLAWMKIHKRELREAKRK